MNTVIRNINGIRGFCIYKNGIPYTYIYTRDAIEMIGLVGYSKTKNSSFLRINTFGEHFESVLQNQNISNQPVQIGINITPNFKFSLINNDCSTTTSCGRKISNANLIRKESKYDSIFPEFILDRILFAIVNKLHNQIAEQFRFELFNTIIPHFQQTASQDQISKVPILNQTTQFMYDNNNYTLITQQQYNFAKQIFDAHINRYALLTGNNDLQETAKNCLLEFDNVLRANDYMNLTKLVTEYTNTIEKLTHNKVQTHLYK